jgi:hypothetical protein
MIKKLASRLGMVVALACFAFSATQSFAQSTTTSGSSSTVTGTNPPPTVTGTNPPPQTVVAMIVLSSILGA